MKGTKTRRLIRRAGADGIGHYHRKGDTRTLCNLPIVREQVAHPTARTCLLCQLYVSEGA